MTNVIRTSKATGLQLQAAAKVADLLHMKNQVYGLGHAILTSSPSPMQEDILRKGLRAAGINYLKVTEKVVPATERDLFQKTSQVGLQNLVQAVQKSLECDTSTRIGVAGKVLYADVVHEAGYVQYAANVLREHGFKRHGGNYWVKVVKIKRKSFTACVETQGHGVIRCSIYEGET